MVHPHDEVNPHYLDHVVTTSQTHAVEASEDILARNGMKLLAKGSRIDGDVKERLLQHKLRKPLEECLRVTGGIVDRLTQAASELLARHPQLEPLCRVGKEDAPEAALSRLRLTPPMESLLTVYCEHRPDKLSHAVAAGLLARGLARKVVPDRPELHAASLIAGLVHDVGELYISPAYLAPGVRLAPEQWGHIVAHPIIAHRVLKDMAGAGPAVAEAVLEHHERLDGFGYPKGATAERLSLAGQILATAELLVGLIESGPRPLGRAAIAMKLIPGEFARPFIDVIATAGQGERATPSRDAATAGCAVDLPRVDRIAATLKRFRAAELVVATQLQSVSERLRPVIAQGIERMHSIQHAFSSTGVDTHDPKQVFAELGLDADPELQLELATIVAEIDWRLGELARESLLRAQLLSPAEAPLVRHLVDMIRGKAAPAHAAL